MTRPTQEREQMKTIHIGPNGLKDQVIIGRFVCDRYRGVFRTAALQARADLGLWYARALGTGFQWEREGETPEKAVAALRLFAAQQQAEIQRVFLA